jgi:hypothetical protein
MRSRLTVACAILAVAVLLPLVVGCGDSILNTVIVSGQVTNHNTGANIDKATVTVGGKSDETDSNGLYSITGVHKGEQVMTVEKDGFQTWTRTLTLYPPALIKNVELNPL